VLVNFKEKDNRKPMIGLTWIMHPACSILAASPAFSGFFLNRFFLFFYSLFGLLFGLFLVRLMLFHLLVFVLFLFCANCAARGTASPAAACVFFMALGAAGTFFGASAAARMRPGHRNAAHADQAGNPDTGKEPFQIFFVHSSLPFTFGLMY